MFVSIASNALFAGAVSVFPEDLCTTNANQVIMFFSQKSLQIKHDRYDHIWFSIERVCISFFTFEYICRFATCPLKFGTKPHSVAQQNAKMAGNLLAHDRSAVCENTDGGASWRQKN